MMKHGHVPQPSFPIQATTRSFAAILVIAVVGACSEAAQQGGHEGHAHDGDEHAEEGRAEEHSEPKTDAHHSAENHGDCEDVELPEGALERYGIKVDAVRAVVLTPTVSAPGHLAFPEGAVARVGSAVPGRIVEIRVRSGDAVSAGDALLVVESSDLGEAQSEYLHRRSVASTVAPSVELSRRAFARAQELYDSVQGIALAEVERREAELRQLEREREVARGAEALALHRLALLGMSKPAILELERTGTIDPRFTVVAPIGGRVVAIAATLGELVDPSKDRLLVIGDVSTLWAIAEVSESRLAEVTLGAPARVKVPALQHAAYEGVVAAVPVTLEASTRTAEVRIEVPNADGALLPGMFIQVEVASSNGVGEAVLAVPDGAVLSIEGQPSVFVPLEPGGSAFCKHEVRVGPQVGESIPVLAGLAAGDLVVVAGAFLLKAEHGKASARHEH